MDVFVACNHHGIITLRGWLLLCVGQNALPAKRAFALRWSGRLLKDFSICIMDDSWYIELVNFLYCSLRALALSCSCVIAAASGESSWVLDVPVVSKISGGLPCFCLALTVSSTSRVLLDRGLSLDIMLIDTLSQVFREVVNSSALFDGFPTAAGSVAEYCCRFWKDFRQPRNRVIALRTFTPTPSAETFADQRQLPILISSPSSTWF